MTLEESHSINIHKKNSVHWYVGLTLRCDIPVVLVKSQNIK